MLYGKFPIRDALFNSLVRLLFISQRLTNHCLSKDVLIKSGKFVYLDSLLPQLKEKVGMCS